MAAALAMATTSALLRHWAFCQTTFANGWDSYYYLVQLKSVAETGHMHSPEGSLIYPYLRLWYWLTHDYVSALKWGMATLCAVWTLLLCCLSKSRQMGLLLAAWSVFSPHLSYFAAQYPKNLLGMVLFVAFLFAVERGGKHRVLLSFILLILNYFGHRMTFGLALVYLLLTALFENRQTLVRWLYRRQTLWLLAGFGLLLVAAGMWVPGLAHLADFQRLNGTFSIIPQWAPWSFFTGFGPDKISGWWRLELAVVLLLLLIKLWQWIKQGAAVNPKQNALTVLCLFLLFPFLEWTFLGIAWRFFLVFVLITPLLIRDNVYKKAYGFLFPLLLISAFFSWKSYVPLQHDPDYARFDRITQKAINHFDATHKPELFIMHNALAEYFTFSTGTDAMPWLPEYAIDSTRLWRIATGVRFETLQYFVGESQKNQVFQLGSGYYLLPEYVWQKARSSAEAEGDADFLAQINTWYNPHAMRPAWLLGRKK